jgi:hypothetical protein
MLPQAVSDHYRAQQRLTLATLSAVKREWARMGDDLDASWRTVGPRVAALTAAAQVGAARDGMAYVPQALAQQGIAAPQVAAVDPRSFAGSATSLDGLTYGSLNDLLYGAVIHARTAPAESLQQRLTVGGKWLEGLFHTQVSDAARMSSSTTIAATTGVGWVRMVNPPCCQRCAVLAGKFFKSNEGFQRHPRCDCRHVPTTDAQWRDAGVFIGPDEVKDLTAAQRQAITDGADMNQVINSHRAGARSKDLMTTTEGATRRGVAGKALGAGKGKRATRLTPEGIYRIASDRDEALRLLTAHGYLL